MLVLSFPFALQFKSQVFVISLHMSHIWWTHTRELRRPNSKAVSHIFIKQMGLTANNGFMNGFGLPKFLFSTVREGSNAGYDMEDFGTI